MSNQVFITFRGEVRLGFVSHLVRALKCAGINVFIDEHERRGEDLTRLFSRINESKIALVIFSNKYAGSRWCLDELEKIKECLDLGILVAIPIFYKIKRTDVKCLEGVFGEEFKRSADKYGKGYKWREAIVAVSNKFAIVVDDTRKESEVVDEIVKAVIVQLPRENPPRKSRVDALRLSLNMRAVEVCLVVVDFIDSWSNSEGNKDSKIRW